MVDLGRRFAEFIDGLSYEDLPEEVQERARTCTLNALGIGIASYKLETASVARSIAKEFEAKSEGKRATLFMDGTQVSLPGAVFANATMCNSRVQDDTYATTHIGSMILPVVLAIAENYGNSGKDILEAIVVGYEVTAALGKELSDKIVARGFNPSPVFGVVGAAAAAGKLMKLNVDKLADAINIAVAFAGGTTESGNAGTLEPKFQIGYAARNGLTAALIGANGIVGAKSAFTGKSGLLYAYAGMRDESIAERIIEGLGKKYEILEVAFKPYPTCAFNQTPFSAALSLVEEYDIKPADVLDVTYCMNSHEANYPGTKFKGPLVSEVNRMMSAPFTIALAIKQRRLQKSDLTKPCDDETMDLVDRITVFGDDNLGQLCGVLQIKTYDGNVYKKEMILAPSSYAYDWERDIELISTAHRENGVGISEEQTSRLISAVEKLPNARDVNNLIDVIGKSF